MAKVAVLITGLGVGGAERIVYEWVRRLKGEFEFVVISLIEGGAFERLLAQEGVRVCSLKLRGRWDLGRAFLGLARVLKAEKPAILHTHMFHANVLGRFVGRLVGVPVIISTVHVEEKEKGWHNWFERLSWRFSDLIICVSERVYRHLRRLGVGERKLLVVRNGIDVERFREGIRKEEARKNLGIEGDKIIGTVARLERQKGLDILITAFAKVLEKFPQARLYIVGEGPLKEKLLEYARGLGIEKKVVFLGKVFPVEPFYYAIDVFVVSSRWEGGPLTLLEAGAAGCPLVSTRVGFAEEVIEPGKTGFLVEVEDEDGLAEAILRLLEDEVLADNMGRQARVYVEKEFGIERSIHRIREIYKAFLEGGAK